MNGLETLSMKDALQAHRPDELRTPVPRHQKQIAALMPSVACIRNYPLVFTRVAIDVKTFNALPEHYRREMRTWSLRY
jgi:hypothetical protein